MKEEDLIHFCGTTDPLLLKLRGGAVMRYHAEGPVLRDHCQSVAEHTWRMMVILLHLFPHASLPLLKGALYHDVPEGLVGDIRATVKRFLSMKESIDKLEVDFMDHIGLPHERDLTAVDYLRLKIADYMELCFFIEWADRKEVAFIFNNGCRYILEATAKLPDPRERDRVTDMIGGLCRKMERFNNVHT